MDFFRFFLDLSLCKSRNQRLFCDDRFLFVWNHVNKMSLYPSCTQTFCPLKQRTVCRKVTELRLHHQSRRMVTVPVQSRSVVAIPRRNWWIYTGNICWNKLWDLVTLSSYIIVALFVSVCEFFCSVSQSASQWFSVFLSVPCRQSNGIAAITIH